MKVKDLTIAIRVYLDALEGFNTAASRTAGVLKRGFAEAGGAASSMETLGRDMQQGLIEGLKDEISIATPRHLTVGIQLLAPEYEAVPIALTFGEARVLWSTAEYLWPGSSEAEIITIATEDVKIPEFALTVAGMGFRVHRVKPERWVVPRKVKAAYDPCLRLLVLRLAT